jgi:hypothetical protein
VKFSELLRKRAEVKDLKVEPTSIPKEEVKVYDGPKMPPYGIIGDDGQWTKNAWRDGYWPALPPRPIDGQPWVIHDEIHHLSNDDVSDIANMFERTRKLCRELAERTAIPQQHWVNPWMLPKFQSPANTPPLKQSTRYFEDTFDPYPRRLEPWTFDSYAACRQTLADLPTGKIETIYDSRDIKTGLLRTITDDRHKAEIVEYDPRSGEVLSRNIIKRPSVLHHTQEKPVTEDKMKDVRPTSPLPSPYTISRRTYMLWSQSQVESTSLNTLKMAHGIASSDEKALRNEALRLSELEVELADKVDAKYAKVRAALSKMEAVPLHADYSRHAEAQADLRKRDRKYVKAGKALADLRVDRKKLTELIERVTTRREFLETTKAYRISERDALFKREEDANRAVMCPPKPRGDASETVVITFTKKFGLMSNRYEYAAISPAGKDTWSVTGRTQLNNISWHDLLQFVQYNENTAQFRQLALNSMVAHYPNHFYDMSGALAVSQRSNLFRDAGMETPTV